MCRQLEQQSIMDYIGKADNIAALHGQITTCDGILLVRALATVWAVGVSVGGV